MIFDAKEHIEVKSTPNAGESLFAKHDFSKGDVVFVAYGEIVPYPTDYTIPIDHKLWIEPRRPGSPAQYLNHSCNPNVGVNHRSVFIAMRNIVKEEEIVTNYAFLGYEFGHEMSIDGSEKITIDLTCKCGTPSCTGKLLCYKEMPPEWREKHREYISDYLLDEKRYPYSPSSKN